MKLRTLIALATIVGANLLVTNVFATDLLEIYEKARLSDPTFKAANAKWLEDRENLSISRGALFPKIDAGGGLSRNRNAGEVTSAGISEKKYYDNTFQYSIKLTQPIFDFSSWTKVWGAQAVVKQATAAFLSAKEDLLLRTSNAYFDVLLAKEVLALTRAQKESLETLFKQAKRKFEVGLIAITDLENAHADYDKAVAEEIAAANTLNDKFEVLNEITGVRYYALDSVKNEFPLVSPEPEDIEKWVKTAEQHNFDLQAAHSATIVAKENVKLANAGHLPTLVAQGQYGYQYDSNYQNNNASLKNKSLTAGLQFQAPIFSGGTVVAQARQAGHHYQNAIATQEKTHRSVISKTRQAYLGIVSDISKIKANRQAIKSAESSLFSTEKSYTVGNRTMADVLNAQFKLYEAKKNFAETEYAYIKQILTLKMLTGALGVSDLKQINDWLEQPVVQKSQAKTKPQATKHQPTKKVQETKVTEKTINTSVATNLGITPVVKQPAVENRKIIVTSTEEVKPITSDNNIAATTTINQ